MFENSNLGCRPPAADDAGAAERGAPTTGWSASCTRSRSPASTARGKHNNWSMATDTGDQPARTRATTRTEPAVPVLLHGRLAAVNKHSELLRASIALRANDHRLGANEAPPAIISIFLGDAAQERVRAAGEARRRGERGRPPRDWARCVLPQLPKDAGDRNRTSPFAFTGNKFEFRAVGSSMSPRSRTRCSTRSSPRRSTTWPARSSACTAATRSRALLPWQRLLLGAQADRVQRRQLRRRVAHGGRAARAAEPAQHARRAAVAGRDPAPSACSPSTTCSPSASSSRATRCCSSSTSRR